MKRDLFRLNRVLFMHSVNWMTNWMNWFFLWIKSLNREKKRQILHKNHKVSPLGILTRLSLFIIMISFFLHTNFLSNGLGFSFFPIYFYFCVYLLKRFSRKNLSKSFYWRMCRWHYATLIFIRNFCYQNWHRLLF